MDTKAELLSLLAYDPERGQLVAKISKGRWVRGKPVGHPYRAGYLVVRFKTKPFYVHRLIWELERGSIPVRYVIDHINGDTHDNRIENLRCGPRSINQRNAKRPTTNTSGHIGVRWHSKSGRWHASIKPDYESFFLGSFNHQSTAIFARRIAQKLFGFHPNHGRDVTLNHRPEP